MGYHIDYNSLDTLYNSIYSQATNWQTALESLSNATTVLAETAEMSGAGADSIRAYMSNVHSTIQALLAQVITLHQYNCLQYKQDYQHNIDTGLYTVIKQSELTSIKSSLSSQKQQACNIEDALSYTLRGIKDIFTVSYNDVTWVNEAHQSAITFLSDLDESIRTLEDSHHSSDFVSTGDLIAKLTAMIEELKGHGRSYKTDFSPEVLAGSETFRNLYASYLNVSKELEEEAEAIETAIENENERIADLQAEYEKRQKEAQAAKWIVTGLCVIGSVVAIAATGGAATPLVVGAISATSSAIIAGTSNLADQYVANGNLNNVDWGSFGSDVAVGAVTGFVTGYVGASVGGAITSGLSKTATGATLLNSSNAVVRIGTGAVIGSVSEVTSGVASRGAVTLITSGGDVEEALDAAFDTKQMAYDAVIGGVTGGWSNRKLQTETVEVEFKCGEGCDEAEFRRQLSDQEAGMQDLTYEEYLKNRENYKLNGRSSEGTAAQQAARDKAYAQKLEQLRSDGLSYSEASEQASEWIKTQDALHAPDQIAGGRPDNIIGMGDRNVNRSIGSQWKSKIDEVDRLIQDIVSKMTDEQIRNTHLNIKLIPT